MASFQGPGTGISGTSNQFSVGYSQSAGYSYGAASAQQVATGSQQTVNGMSVGYAQSAGNINGYAPQAGYANQSAATAQTIQVGSTGVSSWYWQGQNTTPSWLWGSNQGTATYVFAPGNLQVGYAGYAGSAGNINGYAPAAGYANQLTVQGIGGSTWAWAGQGGIPNHYWGSNQGGYMLVWQGNQGYAGYAGSAGNINGYAPTAGYAYGAGNINGYAPVVGFSNGAPQGGGPGTGNALQGAAGFTRQGRAGSSGNYWGNGYVSYNQQGTTAFTDFNVQYGNYFGGNGYYWGTWNPVAMGFQSPNTTRLFMFGVNNSVNYFMVG
jgi:hypothetical protein